MERMTKDQMLDKYEVLGFSFGLCVVKDKETGQSGTLDFTKDPQSERYYYGFMGV